MFRKTLVACARTLCLAVGIVAAGGALAEQILLPRPEDGTGQFFGSALAFDETGGLAIGAKWGGPAGYVDIFRAQGGPGENWQATGRVVSSYPGMSSFGYALVTGGGWLVVVDRDNTQWGGPSYVNFYRHQAGGWVFAQRILLPDITGSTYVGAMAVSDTALAVRMDHWGDNVDEMHTVVYDYVDGVWGGGSEIERAPGDPWIGKALVIRGDLLIASGVRSVHTFIRGSNGWTRIASMADPVSNIHHTYGGSLALCGARLVVADSMPGAFDSSVYIYRRSGDGWTADGAPLTAPAGMEGRGFPWKIACDGDGMAISTATGGTVFTLSLAGDRTMQALQVAEPETNRFSGSIAVHGGTVAVGGNNRSNVNLGAVFVFDNAIDPVFAAGFE